MTKNISKVKLNALITGASRGIGKCVAISIAEKCSSMILASRSYKDLKSTADKIVGCETKICAVDLSIEKERKKLNKFILDSNPPINTIIHCAGDGLPIKFLDLDLTEARRLHELHCFSILDLLQNALPNMIENRFGRVIAISSLSPLRPKSFMVPYASSKASMRVALQCLADEVIQHGITINIISPGSVDTSLGNQGRLILAKLNNDDDLIAKKERLKHLPYGLPLKPYDIASIINLLLDSSANIISGQDIITAGTFIMR